MSMRAKQQNEVLDNLYDRGKKLLERLNQATAYEEPLKDSVIIAGIPQEPNNNLKSYDTMDKAELLEYSLNRENGSSILKESISSSNGNNSHMEGIVNAQGKFIKVDISQYKSLFLKYGKIIFKSTYMNNSFVNNNDILYLESKIPIFKANNSGEIIYDTLKNYHQQGSDKEDKANVVNINQSNTHKINLDENNFAAITGSKIFIFLHKIIQGNFRKKTNGGAKKNNSSANSTEVIQNSDIIIGYSTLDMNKIFLSEDFKYVSQINIIEKKKINKDKAKKPDAKNGLNEKNKRGMSKEKDSAKDKNDALYDEKGERIIGTLDITCYLKRQNQKLFKDINKDNKINNDNQLINSLNNINNINNINNNQNQNMNMNNNNNQFNNINMNNNNTLNFRSNYKEFVVGQPAGYNQHNNSIIDNNINNSNYNIIQKDYDFENNREKKLDDGVQEIHTDINGDILILYLKVNELKASNDNVSIQTSLANINNINNINNQINNNPNNNNKNIIFYNYSGPQPAKRNYFLRHKIFPDNKDANSEIIWNKVSPDFNYSIQMPFTLTQKTAELLDNSKFIVEIWNKGENSNECLGIVSFDLRNVLEALKVDDNTITTNQLYKNSFPYIIYDDYYQVTPIADAPDLGALFLKASIGIGTPSQINSFINLIKKTQQSIYNQTNGLYTGSINNNVNNNVSQNINKKENTTINAENKNNVSLDPFKEPNKDMSKDNINNVSRAADMDVDGMLEKNHKDLVNNNNINNIISSKDSFKKTDTLDDHSNKKKITNPFLVPQNYDQDANRNSKKQTGCFNTNNILSGDMNYNNESQRYNNPEYVENKNKNSPFGEIKINNDTQNINKNEKTTVEYNINIIHKNESNHDDTNNNNNFIEDDNYDKSQDFVNNNDRSYTKVNPMEKKEDEKDINTNNNIYNNNNIDNNINDEIEEDNIYNTHQNKNKDMNNNIMQNKNISIPKENDDEPKIKPNNEMANTELYNNINNNNNMNKENISHVKKHIFTISIDKIYNCQIISKLPPSYLRYQFFTDQKPIRSELFNYSQYSIDSSVIDVDMKSIHSIILPKVEKIKDYLSDFLVEFLYDNPNNQGQIKNSNDNHIIIGRVNIPSDEFASLIYDNSNSNSNNNINENNRVLFIYGTEKIQRNKCIIGKLKLNFKYACVDVPVNYNGLFNGSVSLSNNGLTNSINNQYLQAQNNFGGSIYLEKETIFNRKIPKNAILKIKVNNFISSSLFEDYYRKQFSISFVFSAFGEVAKMENQYGKRSTSKKHNLLNCDYNEILSYKLEIDQDIIDYLKCRSGVVYLMYKVSGRNKNNFDDINNDFEDNDNNEDILSKNINMMDLINTTNENNKRVIGKGLFNLNEILTSADTNNQEISISQIGNGSMSLGMLNISLTLENDNSNTNSMNIINEEGDKLNKEILSPLNKFKQGLNNTTSDLYKYHNQSFNKCDPSFYLNGKFLFSIDFRKFYYELNSETGSIINNSNTYFYFVFKLGNKIKKISPKFNRCNNELFSLSQCCNLLLINYVELIELDLNFNKKLPNDIYNLFNEGIFEIKMYQSDNVNSLGSFYIDLHKLITSNFYSENLLYSGNNIINLIDVRTNLYKNCKIELNVTIFKLNELQINNDIINKMNALSGNVINTNNNINNTNNDGQNNNNNTNIVDISVSNLDYCEYYQYLFVKEFSEYLIQNIFSEIMINDKEGGNKEKDNEIDKNNNSTDNNNGNNNNLFNIEKIKNIFNFNSVDMFTFIHNNLIPLLDNKGMINIDNFKKIFQLITKVNYDTFDYYYSIMMNNNGNTFDENTFENYLNVKIINLDNEDINILNYLKDKQTKIDLSINNNTTLNEKNNNTIKKLLTTNYNYGFNETNDYFDVVSLCLFLFDYYYNLNDNTLTNNLRIKQNDNSNNKPDSILLKQPQYIIPNRNENNQGGDNNSSKISNNNLNNNIHNQSNNTKIMVVSVLSGHNIIKPNSDFTSRPNCYFVLEFDDKNYTSDVVMNSSQPNFNEELEIKINSEDYIQKLNTLLIYITVFSFVDEKGSIFIGRCEITPSKMFPFLNDNNECDDFFHLIGEEGQVMGQLNVKFRFDPEVLGSITSKAIVNNSNALLMTNFNNMGGSNTRDMMNRGKPNNNYNNTVSYSMNNYDNNNIVNINNKKKKFMMTGDMNDPLHKKFEDAMNSIDNLTQLLQNKVINDENNINMNKNKLNYSDKKSYQIQDDNNQSQKIMNYSDNQPVDNNYNNEIIENENDNIENNHSNNNNFNNNLNENINIDSNMNLNIDNDNGINNNNDNFVNIDNNGNLYGQQPFEEVDANNMNNNNISGEIDFGEQENQENQEKLMLTDCNIGSFGSQRLSANEENENKASFYSDINRNNNNKNNKKNYLQNYDKQLLNRIEKVMKNKK